jgi:hypothetical protein
MSAWEITKKLMMCYFGAALVQGLFLIGVAEPSHNGVGGMALAFFFWALPIMSIVGAICRCTYWGEAQLVGSFVLFLGVFAFLYLFHFRPGFRERLSVGWRKLTQADKYK